MIVERMKGKKKLLVVDVVVLDCIKSHDIVMI